MAYEPVRLSAQLGWNELEVKQPLTRSASVSLRVALT